MRALRHLLPANTSNLAICLLSASLIAVAVSNWTRPTSVSAQATAPARKQMNSESKAVLNALQDAFVNIAETVEPSVVTISAKANPNERSATPMQDGGDMDIPEPFRDFFGRIPRRPQMPEGGGESRGSGVIVKETGNTIYVLTNNHVVDGRARYKVTLYDKSEVPAELVGRDVRSDLAVLKFQVRKPLPAGSIASLGNSDGVKVGQWAIAIGSPLGYDSTLTVGVISAKGRELNGVGRTTANYSDLLQTDASINPGNSGGPLVNIDGDVVGINVAIAAPFGNQGNIGIGFAIPSNTARQIADQLISRGKVTRGYLGVAVNPDNRELSPALRQALKVPHGGALIETVQPDTPAARAGVKEGDVLVKFGDRELHSFLDLEHAVAATTPGASVPVEVIRDGRPVRLTITVMERPGEEELAKSLGAGQRELPQNGAAPQAVKTRFGMSIRQAEGGVAIVSITPGSVADDSGLQPGDVVSRVGDTPTPTVEAFQKALNAAGNGGAVLRVHTQGSLHYLELKP